MRWIGMSEDKSHVTLHRFEGTFQLSDPPDDPDRIRHGIVVDVEATGLDTKQDQIIEFAGRPFSFDRETGAIVTVGPAFESLHDPGEPLSPEITKLTGLTDEDLKGHQLDTETIKTMLEKAHIIIAHNARYDRPMIERVTGHMQKVWGCSLSMVPWRDLGFPSAKLGLLAVYHGFFFDGHRAITDVNALLHLLTFQNPESAQPYLKQILQASRRRVVLVSAFGAPYDMKDSLKARNYRWDGAARVWRREVDEDCADAEEEWLREHIYPSQDVAEPGLEYIHPFHRFC